MEEDVKIESYFDWVDSSVINDIDKEFASTFCQSNKQSNLTISRFQDKKSKDDRAEETQERFEGKNDDDYGSKSELDPWPERVSNLADLKHVNDYHDPCQVFHITQRNSYARLNISRGLFGQLLDTYAVFDRIWDFILPFSFKTRESDIGHAPIRFRQSGSLFQQQSMKLGSFECAYGFRYVELNHRKVEDTRKLDYDPWSVRQSAVYQKYDSTLDRITFILISPSNKMRTSLEKAIQRRVDSGQSLNVFDLHRIILSTLHENWRLYIRSVEKLLMTQSDRVTLTKVRSETERLSPLDDFTVNFIDRQKLKQIEDKILDLEIVFESLHNTLSKLQRQCRIHCVPELCKDCNCSRTIEELEEQMHEAQVNLKKSGVLHKRAQGTAHLLSDLLDYENAQIAHHNEQALNRLVKESKDENSKMRLLTERSSRDAAAVKILTVITLIYLPMTTVLNFFSTQLIHVNENGQLSVIAQSWWFVVISVPLTIGTFFVWKIWLAYTMKIQERKASPQYVEGKATRRHPPFASNSPFNWPRWRHPPQHHPSEGILETPPIRRPSTDVESLGMDPVPLSPMIGTGFDKVE